MSREMIFAVLSAVLCNLVFYHFICQGFGVRVSPYLVYIMGIAGTILFCVYLTPGMYYPLLFLSLFMMHMAVMLIFCCGNLKMKVYTAGFGVFQLMVIEGSFYSIFSCIVKEDLSVVISEPQMRLKIAGCSCIASAAYMCYLKKSGFPQYLKYLKDKIRTVNVLLYSELALGGILAYAMGVYYVEEGSYLINNFFLGLCLMSALVYYLLLEYSVKLRRAIDESQDKKRILEEQLERQLRHYQSQALYIERFRRFKHDYQNQIKGLSYTVDGGDLEHIRQYVYSLADGLNKALESYHQYSDNRLMDAMIHDLANTCSSSEIRLEASVHIEENFGLSDIDFCTVFSNVFNNAVEAASKLPAQERFITVEGKQKGKWNTVTCRNSFNGELKKEGEAYITTKKDMVSHGIGVSKIREIVEAHQGIVTMEPEGGVFCVTLCMANPQASR